MPNAIHQLGRVEKNATSVEKHASKLRVFFLPWLSFNSILWAYAKDILNRTIVPDAYLLKGGDPLEPLRVGGAPTPSFVGLKGGIFKVKVGSKLIILNTRSTAHKWLNDTTLFLILILNP